MLIQNADRTTYGINKIVVSILAFVIFFVVGFVSWQWMGVAPEPWRLRTLVLTPLTMSLLLYVCCDQLGVYYRCMTLGGSIRRFVMAYACFVVLSIVTWKYFVPFSANIIVQTLAYLLTFLGALWLRISRFRAEKRLVEEAPTLVVGIPDHVKEFRKMLESDHVDFKDELLVMAPEEVDRAEVRNLLIKGCISKVVFLPEEVDSAVARCLVELCGKMGVDFYASMVVSMPDVHKTYFGVLGGTRMLVYKSTPIPYTTSWQLKKILDWVGALLLLVGTFPLWVLAAVGIKLSDRGPVFYRQCNAPRHLIELRQVSYITCLSASSVQGVCIDSASPLQAASRSPQSTVSSSSLTTPSRSILSLASASRCITLARSLAG